MDVYLTHEELVSNRRSDMEARDCYKKAVKTRTQINTAQKRKNREYKTVLCKRTSDYKEKANDGNPKCD
jgi:hypothetical protein